MKNIFLLFIFLPFFSFAQQNVALCLQKSNGRLQVCVIPSATFQGVFSNVQFTIESDDNSISFGNIMQPSPENQYIPMEKAGVETIIGNKKYQTFVGTGLVNMNVSGINTTWQANTPYTIMELMPSDTSANFSIAHNAYTTASNRDAYIELNGNSRTGLITCNINSLSNAMNLLAEWKENDAFLQWSDEKKASVKHYIIERTNGRDAYQAIDTVEKDRLFYYDKNSKLANSTQFIYRIKALSYNGEEYFSNLKSLWISNDFQVFSYPNPVEGNLHLQISDNSSTFVKVIIFTSEGKQVYENTFHQFDIDIATQDFAAGTYFAKIFTENSYHKQIVFVKK